MIKDAKKFIHRIFYTDKDNNELEFKHDRDKSYSERITSPESFEKTTNFKVSSVEKFIKSDWEVKEHIVIVDKLTCPICDNILMNLEHGEFVQCDRCKNIILAKGNGLTVGITEKEKV